jgi:hypothetical protein
VTNEMLQTLLATYGAPLVLAVFLWWQSRGSTGKEDPGQKILDAIADISERVAKIEGYLEGKK